MARLPRRPLALLLAVGVAGSAIGLTAAAFSGSTTEQIDVAAAPDWTAPAVNSTVIGKATGGETGYIRQGAANTYYVYADVTDSGNPAAGVGTVTANVSNASTGQTSVAMSAGSYTAFGTSYNYRSTSAVAPNAVLSAGSKAYTIAAVDLASPVNTLSPPANGSVVVDNTVPTPTSISTTNAVTAGRPVQNDTITFTWNDPIDPNSIVANWTGGATNCVVRINNNIAATANNDQLLVYNAANTAVLPLTTANGVNLGTQNYVGLNRTFGASSTASSMTRSGNSITITLGTQSGAGTTSAAGQMIWNPSATATDRAGNASGTATVTAASKAEF